MEKRKRTQGRRGSILPGVAGVLLLALCACSGAVGNGTRMDFRFSPGGTGDFWETKELYINDDMELLRLEGTLRIRTGEVAVEVTGPAGDPLWAGTFAANETFAVTLPALEAGDRPELAVGAQECGGFELTLTCGVKLVPDPQTPERPAVPEREREESGGE